jgi:hypothetical protein
MWWKEAGFRCTWPSNTGEVAINTYRHCPNGDFVAEWHETRRSPRTQHQGRRGPTRPVQLSAVALLVLLATPARARLVPGVRPRFNHALELGSRKLGYLVLKHCKVGEQPEVHL